MRCELLHEGGVVAYGPVLDALAVDDADDMHLLVGEAAARGGQAEEVPGVLAGVGAPDDHLVVLGDHVVDFPPLVAERLAVAVTFAVAGGSARAAVPTEERPAIRAIIEEPDPSKQLHLYAHTQPGIWERVGPLLRVLEAAAASEPDLRKLQQEQDSQRHAGLTRFTRLLEEHGALREDLTPEHAADIIMTLGSFATQDSLGANRSWTHDQYETWLADTLHHCLLS
jgi:hypothetical protein